MEICKICNKEFNSKKSLQIHLSKTHSFTKQNLKDYYDFYLRKENEGYDPFTENETNFVGFTKGYSRFDGSEESNKKKIASSTIEYWVKVKGYTKEEAKKYLEDKHKRSTEKANKTKKKLLEENPDRKYLGGYGVKKFMLMGYTESEAKRLHKEIKEKRAKIWHKIYKNNPDIFKGKRKGQIEYWLNKGYSEEEAKIKVKEAQTTFTLKKCIKKYGKEKGTKFFNERQEKWKKSLQKNFELEGDGRSPSSQFANSIIKELCSYLNIEIPKKEKWIKDKETENAYSYDFQYEKKIIEFNGDYWHCNPKLYEADYFHKNKGLSADEIWDYDKQKIETAEKYGYKVLVVWESDWIEDHKTVLEKCIKFINKD